MGFSEPFACGGVAVFRALCMHVEVWPFSELFACGGAYEG